jgi:hypothetical protein
VACSASEIILQLRAGPPRRQRAQQADKGETEKDIADGECRTAVRGKRLHYHRSGGGDSRLGTRVLFSRVTLAAPWWSSLAVMSTTDTAFFSSRTAPMLPSFSERVKVDLTFCAQAGKHA